MQRNDRDRVSQSAAARLCPVCRGSIADLYIPPLSEVWRTVVVSEPRQMWQRHSSERFSQLHST